MGLGLNLDEMRDRKRSESAEKRLGENVKDAGGFGERAVESGKYKEEREEKKGEK